MYFAIGGRQHAVGPVPRDLRRQGVDRAVARATTGARPLRSCGGSWRRSTASRTRRRSRPPGRTWATRTATSATPPASPSSTRTAKAWQDRALAETDPAAAIHGAAGPGARQRRDPFHRKKDDPAPDAALQGADPGGARPHRLGEADRRRSGSTCCASTRCCSTAWAGRTRAARDRVVHGSTRSSRRSDCELNAELCQLLVYLEAPGVAAKTLKLLAEAPTQEEQIEYAQSLRMLKTGWTPEQRKEYFAWFLKAADFKGGNSFQRLPRQHQGTTRSRR